jgi:hypothetical protein
LCCPGLTINGGRRGLSSKIEIVTAEWRPILVNEYTLNHWNFISNNHGRKRIASDVFTSGKHTNVSRNIKLFKKPYIKKIAERILFCFVRAICRAKKANRSNWLLQYIFLKGEFKSFDITHLCRGKYRSQLAVNVCCVGGMPEYDVSVNANKLRGRPACYGDCDKKDICKVCGNMEFILRDENLERESWADDVRVKVSQYTDENGKQSNEIFIKTLNPSEFLDLFTKVISKYCSHNATKIRAHTSMTMHEQNMKPDTMTKDNDFSENAKLNETHYEIQSANWKQ